MEIRAVAHADVEALLALIADYQRFYDNPAPDDARNGPFFARFVAPSDVGLLIGAFDDARQTPTASIGHAS